MIARLPLLLLLTLAGGLGQTPPPPSQPAAATRTLRLLPLGEPPPFRQEVRDGVRYELEQDANSIPPRQVVLTGDKAATPIPLNLRRATAPLAVPTGTAPVVLALPAAGAQAAPVPWLSVKLPETGDMLALVWRDPAKPWSQPRTLVLPDSAAAFPAGKVRIVNLLPAAAAAIFGTERVLIPPGKTLLRAVAPGVDLGIQLAFQTATGEFQQFYSSSLLLHPNERAQVLLYRADGENPRQAVKTVIFNEAAPAVARVAR